MTIANGSFFGISKLTADADVDDRQLIVFTMADLTRWQLLRVWADVLRGKRAAPAAARYLTTTEVTVEANPPQYIDVDGEPITRTPAHFSVAPEALKVMAPRTFRDH